MTQTAFFGGDDPIAAAVLDSSNNNELSFLNVQRRRLQKFARQYAVLRPAAVETLRSQGEPDITLPAVVATRDGFTQLRRDLPVLDQYYEYSGDAAILAKIKEICLDWVRTNVPDGKPVNETNFEWLVRVLKRRRAAFDAAEWASAEAWLQALRAAKEGFDFQAGENEGTVTHGNWYTHHYKVLLLALDALGETAARDALLAEIDDFATRNFPHGNAAITAPGQFAIVGTSASGSRFDIGGNELARFMAGACFTVVGNSQGNDGTYTVSSAQYLSGSNKTRITTVEAPMADGGGGTLHEIFDPARHDMPRAATAAGESIDYVRRDALHYHVYTLWPWIEIALSTGARYRPLVDAGWDFFVERLLSPVKHYEFAATSDAFDAVRWQASHPEYLAPQAMFKPQRASGMILSYLHYRRSVDPGYAEPQALVALCLRGTDTLASFWPSYFRWMLGYGGNG